LHATLVSIAQSILARRQLDQGNGKLLTSQAIPLSQGRRYAYDRESGCLVPEQGPVLYILVESVDEYSKKVQEAGGTIVVPKMAVPTVGYFAQALDTEGNVFAIWEENPQAQ